jgi:hypothetical protein
MPDKRALVYLCGRCGAVESADDYYEALAAISQEIDAWGNCDLHEVALALATDRGADEPTDEDYVEALVTCIKKSKEAKQ